MRATGHQVFTPTAAGNRPGCSKAIGLADAIKSINSFLTEEELRDIVLVGHSYGGMIISALADTAADRVRRLVYWNAFVPDNGESVTDMMPTQFVALFHAIAADRGDGPTGRSGIICLPMENVSRLVRVADGVSD